MKKKRKQLIGWAVIGNDDGNCHVVPIRKLRSGGLRKVILQKHLLGHVTSETARCWCKPKRGIRHDGSLLFTHDDLPN